MAMHHSLAKGVANPNTVLYVSSFLAYVGPSPKYVILNQGLYQTPSIFTTAISKKPVFLIVGFTLLLNYSSVFMLNVFGIVSLVVHLVTHDYSSFQGGGGGGLVTSVKSSLLFTTFIGSTLNSQEACAYACFNVMCFVFFPRVRYVVLQRTTRKYDHFLSLGVCGVAGIATWFISRGMVLPYIVFWGYLAVVGGVSGCVPLWVWKRQQFKKVMCGPWDVFHVRGNE